jgi:hypothetical protein
MLAIPLLVPISAVKQHRAISSTVVGDQTETNGVVVLFNPIFFLSSLPRAVATQSPVMQHAQCLAPSTSGGGAHAVDRRTHHVWKYKRAESWALLRNLERQTEGAPRTCLCVLSLVFKRFPLPPPPPIAVAAQRTLCKITLAHTKRTVLCTPSTRLFIGAGA